MFSGTTDFEWIIVALVPLNLKIPKLKIKNSRDSGVTDIKVLFTNYGE